MGYVSMWPSEYIGMTCMQKGMKSKVKPICGETILIPVSNLIPHSFTKQDRAVSS